MKPKYKVGDTIIAIIAIEDYDGAHIKNKMGTIKAIYTKSTDNLYGIEFFKFMDGHNGSWVFKGKEGYCWNLGLGSFKSINKLKLKKLLKD